MIKYVTYNVKIKLVLKALSLSEADNALASATTK